MSTDDMLVTTCPLPEGYKIVKIFGLVTGVTIRSRGMGGVFIAGLQSLAGGEITAYTSEIEKARFQAIERMKDKGASLGANAIIMVDIETSSLSTSDIIIAATGTAMIVEKKK